MFVLKCFPIKSLEPWVFLQFRYAMLITKSVGRLPPDAFVSEVSSLDRPIVRNLIGFNLDLLS